MKQLFITTISILLLISSISNAQLRPGDPGVTLDRSKLDSDYPQMERWAKAGSRNGIPFINSFYKQESMNPGNSASINAAINRLASSLPNGKKGLLILKNGTYTINSSVKMKSNVSLKGVSRNGVICSITMTDSDAFSFDDVKNCGIYNLTIKGSWAEPKYLWNYSLDANREFSNGNVSVRLRGGTENCWLDKVTILNSARDPLRCAADHNTFRDLIVDGCKRKAGGAEGYFFIQGRDNLVTGCQVTHLRHISLQGSNVEYNVVFDNDFRQEVSFHSGDAGNNLIENNRITLPSDMPPIEAGERGPYPETENGKPVYFAIMGPWSSQHQNSARPNFIYRNRCVQNNHSYGSRTPWSNDNKVYFGPKKKGLSITERINNFPEYSAGTPASRTLYAINVTSTPSGGGGNSTSAITETFESMTLNGWAGSLPGGKYTFVGQNNITWEIFGKGTSGHINGTKNIYFNSGQTGIKSKTISGGISSFSVKCKNLWSSGTERTLELRINNQVKGRIKKTGSAVYEFKVDHLNTTGNITIELKNVSSGGNNTIAIDDIKWTGYSASSSKVTTGINSEENNLYNNKLSNMAYPNPFKSELKITNNGIYQQAILMDITGKVISSRLMEGKSLIVFRPSYTKAPAGMYLLKLIKDTGVDVIKIKRN